MPRRNHGNYAEDAAGQEFNTKNTVQPCELKAALPHIPHLIDRHTQQKINRKPANISAFVSPNDILIPKRCNCVLNEADWARPCHDHSHFKEKAQKKSACTSRAVAS